MPRKSPRFLRILSTSDVDSLKATGGSVGNVSVTVSKSSSSFQFGPAIAFPRFVYDDREASAFYATKVVDLLAAFW